MGTFLPTIVVESLYPEEIKFTDYLITKKLYSSLLWMRESRKISAKQSWGKKPKEPWIASFLQRGVRKGC